MFVFLPNSINPTNMLIVCTCGCLSVEFVHCGGKDNVPPVTNALMLIVIHHQDVLLVFLVMFGEDFGLWRKYFEGWNYDIHRNCVFKINSECAKHQKQKIACNGYHGVLEVSAML